MAVPNEVPIGSAVREFPAGSFNALVKGHRERNLGGQKPSIEHPPLPRLVVTIKNGSDADRFKGNVLGIEGTALTWEDNGSQAFHGGAILKGIVPTTAKHASSFVVLLETIAKDRFGKALLMGVDWARVNVSDALHKFARVKNNEAGYLESGGTGARMLYKEKEAESGSAVEGEQWVLILIGLAGGSNLRHARVYGGPISAATGNLTADWGSGNVKFMDDETGELDSDPTAVDNLWNYAWVTDAMVALNTAFTPPRVVNGTCAAFATWE